MGLVGSLIAGGFVVFGLVRFGLCLLVALRRLLGQIGLVFGFEQRHVDFGNFRIEVAQVVGNRPNEVGTFECEPGNVYLALEVVVRTGAADVDGRQDVVEQLALDRYGVESLHEKLPRERHLRLGRRQQTRIQLGEQLYHERPVAYHTVELQLEASEHRPQSLVAERLEQRHRLLRHDRFDVVDGKDQKTKRERQTREYVTIRLDLFYF